MSVVGWLEPGDQWDTTLVSDLLSGALYPHGLKFRHEQGFPRTGGAVIVCPARYWAGREAEITDQISFYGWCLMFVTSDEEATFSCSNVLHDNIRFWIQTPRKGVNYPEARFFGVGYTPHMRDLPQDPPDKSLDLFLSCQRTHSRRIQAFEALKDIHLNVERRIVETGGFTQGLPVGEYTAGMCGARVAPCPSGAVSPDSFRLFEALEAHAIPIADTVSPVDGETDYWSRILPGAPFPVLRDYADLPGYIGDALKDWPRNVNRITAWWMQTKRRYAQWLREDLQALKAVA